MTKKKPPLKVIAGDFNSPLFRNQIFTKSFLLQADEFNIPRAIIGNVGKKGEMEYIADLSTWTKAYEELKKQIEKDIHLVEKIIDKTNKLGEEFNKWSEKEIFNKNVSEFSNSEIQKLLKEFIEKQARVYAYGTMLPLIDFGGFAYVEGNLKKILKEKLPEKQFNKYFEVLTHPLHNSFAQDQEEDLLRLIEPFHKDKNWIKDTKTKTLEELRDLYPEFYKNLQAHTQKYCWVYYVFQGPAYTEAQFLDFIKEELEKGTDPSKKLKELTEKKQRIEKLRKEYIQDLKPTEFESMILHLVGKLVWAKPTRKDFQSKSYYHVEKLLREAAKRLHISLQQVRAAPFDLLEKALETEKIDEDVLNSCYNFHVCLPNNDGTLRILHGKQAHEFYETVEKPDKDADLSNIKEITGACAQPGKAKGVVKIVNKPADMHKMKQGDILVSVATTPSVVPAMKKAAAIVTDEGGLTCHAAIVSRELGIPCVTGTKNATQILKDQDEVEVDAKTGIIKILKRA